MKNVNEPLLIMQNFFNTAQINMNVSLSSMPGITGVHTSDDMKGLGTHQVP